MFLTHFLSQPVCEQKRTQRRKKGRTPEISKDLITQRNTKKQNKAKNKVIKLKEQAKTQGLWR